MNLRLKWQSLSGRERRTFRLAAVVVIPVFAWPLVVRPVASSFAGLEGRVAQERDLLHRELALLRERPGREKVFQQAAVALLEQSPRLFDGRDTVTAGAALVSYVTGQAATHRVFVQSSDPGTAAIGDDGILRIRVEVRAVSDIAGLLAWLGAMELGKKLVRVREISILPAAEIGSPGQGTSTELLGLTLVVEGFALYEPGSASVLAKGAGQ
jgi:hypothetical protein